MNLAMAKLVGQGVRAAGHPGFLITAAKLALSIKIPSLGTGFTGEPA